MFISIPYNILGNLSNVSFGAILGWLLITAAGLQKHDRTHLGVQPLSDLELTWVVSVVYLAAGVGAAYLSWMADGFGKKHTLCTLSLAKFVSKTLAKSDLRNLCAMMIGFVYCTFYSLVGAFIC